MKITVFDTDFTNSKFAKSPFGDKTFEFISKEVETIEEAMAIMQNSYYLNRNYAFKTKKRLRRTKKDLEKYLSPKLEFVIVDFDRVNTLNDQNSIIKFLREKDYHFGLIPSRSWNGVDSFNMKCIIKVKGLNNKASIFAILEEMNKALFQFCKIDLTSTNEGAYQAPSLKNEIIDFHEGKYIPNLRRKEIPRQEIVFDLPDNFNDILGVCMDEYTVRGFSATQVNEERGIITFSHPSERTPNGYFLFLNNPFFMNHFNKDRSFSIFEQVKHNPVVKEYLEDVNHKKREVEFSGVGSFNFSLNINQRFIKIGEKETKFLNKWLDSDGLLKIKSAMGTGKSSVIEETIRLCGERRQKVLLITNRISVAKDFQGKYGIKLYSDGNYEIGDDLIVQFDSLWKYSLRHFDVIILDEFVSIILHSRNNMGEYGNLNRVKLMYAMRTKLCMIADAFLYGCEDELIPTKPKFSLINSYREDMEVISYPNIESITYQIKEISLKEKSENRKVTISCTSKSTAKALETLCENEGFKVVALTADTLEAEKELIYDLFEKETHDGWDVFIFTPTLTVGVSILNKSDYHFHVDESMSVDAVSSLQMTRRNRKSKKIHYYVRERKRYLETNIETINEEVRENIEKYYKRNNSLLVEVDEYGDFKMSKIAYFMNGVEVLYNKIENNHRHSFEILLSHQLKNKPKEYSGKGKIDISNIKRLNKSKEIQKMKTTLENMCEVDYDKFTLEDFNTKSFLKDDKERLQKFMSEVKKNLKENVTNEELRDIVELEITSNFKFLGKLKKLKTFLTKSEQEIQDLLAFIVSENTIDQGQISYFKYLSSLKKGKLKLKEKITMVEINEMNKKIGWGDFKGFLSKVGYKRRNGIYILPKEYITYVKLVK